MGNLLEKQKLKSKSKRKRKKKRRKEKEKYKDDRKETKPFCPKKISSDRRYYLRNLIIIINVFAMLIYCTEMSFGIYSYLYLQSKGHLIANGFFTIGTLSFFYISLNIIMMIIHFILIFGTYQCYSIRNQIKWTYLFHNLASTILIIIVIVVPFLIILTLFNIRSITTGFQEGIKSSMGEYSLDIGVKRIIDELQLTYQCCGASSGNGYKNWHELKRPWVAKLYQSNRDVKKSVPFSCCKIDYLNMCNNEEDSVYALESINTHGCGGLFSDWIKYILSIAIYLYLLSMFVNCVVFIIFQYWRISTQNALSHCDPHGTAIGWIWPINNKNAQAERYITRLIDMSMEKRPLLDYSDVSDVSFSPKKLLSDEEKPDNKILTKWERQQRQQVEEQPKLIVFDHSFDEFSNNDLTKSMKSLRSQYESYKDQNIKSPHKTPTSPIFSLKTKSEMSPESHSF